MQSIIIKAPLDGVLFPLEEVPDEVFAQKMVGDGISIDPFSNILYAPIDGIVSHIHAGLHAITLTHSSGLEVMMHIGLDTVMLRAQGFEAKVVLGQHVQVGDPLIMFDMEFVSQNAKSLLTQIVFTNDEMIESIEKFEGNIEHNISTIMQVMLKREYSFDGTILEEGFKHSAQVIITHKDGLHARPAASLSALAKSFPNEITLIKGTQSVNAKSVTAIMMLDIRYQESIQIEVIGENAEMVLEALKRHIESVHIDMDNQENYAPKPNNQEVTSGESADILRGIVASKGIALGKAYLFTQKHHSIKEYAKNPQEEITRLQDAIVKAVEQLEEFAIGFSKEAEIFKAHQELLRDPELFALAQKRISDFKSAEFGWSETCRDYREKLAASPNNYLAQRANDIEDIQNRVLSLLVVNTLQNREIPQGAIVVAKEMTPSLLVELSGKKIAGLCIATGGASSHVAILANSFGIPTLVGIGKELSKIVENDMLIVDAIDNAIYKNPSKVLVKQMQDKLQHFRIKETKILQNASQSAVTKDDNHIEVYANIGSLEDAKSLIGWGADGVGLFRSEFLFLDKQSAPSEEEQFKIYQEALNLIENRVLVIRTLDIGGDKPLSYLKLPSEENPFLGLRGARVSLQNTELFRVQIRAILRTSLFGDVRIMFPMISKIEEIIELKKIVEEERELLGVEPIPIGIMVEVPSAALLAEHFAKEVDFFSIGTNDLAQYTLAADRGNTALTSDLDMLHPSVLKLMALIIAGAKKYNRSVSVCGNIASNSQAIPLLIGLGINELSVSLPRVPSIKESVRSLRLSQSQVIASKALECKNATEVLELLS